MKAKIHPNYFEDLKITCSCGNVIVAGSTRKELKTEICSACHPFYTGQQKLIDTTGRVDKFLAKVKKAQEMKEKQVEIVDEELEELLHHEPVAIPTEEPVQTTLLADEENEEVEPEKVEVKTSKVIVKSEKKVAKPAVKSKSPKAVKVVAKAPAKKAAVKKPAAKKAK